MVTSNLQNPDIGRNIGLRLAELAEQPYEPGNDDLLRTFGVYRQRPREDNFYMVRIRIPFGILRSHQLRVLGELANQHGRGLADITVRQNLQLHWVRPESLPAVMEELYAIGL